MVTGSNGGGLSRYFNDNCNEISEIKRGGNIGGLDSTNNSAFD